MRILLLVLGLGLTGCAWHRHPKSETHIYEGASPKIHYMDKPETAGGQLNTY